MFFLEIECDDSLRQCLMSSEGKTHETKFGRKGGGKSGPNGPKLGPKLGFLPFLKFGLLIFF